MTAHPASGAGPGRCRSCSAPILWVKTASGKATPLDAAPVADGEWCVVAGVAVNVGAAPDLFAPPERYRVHWATCPNAGDHRRPR